MKKYKPCEVCDCEDCKIGRYGRESWYCPILEKQICNICCVYDTDETMRNECKRLNCPYFVEYEGW